MDGATEADDHAYPACLIGTLGRTRTEGWATKCDLESAGHGRMLPILVQHDGLKRYGTRKGNECSRANGIGLDGCLKPG